MNGSSNDPCSNLYHGPSPESEPCVKTFATKMREIGNRIDAFFSLHSFFQLILLPNSYTLQPPPSARDNVRI